MMKGMNGDKAMGANGSTMAFFQVYWDVFKEYIMHSFHGFMLEETLISLSLLSFRRNPRFSILRIFPLLVYLVVFTRYCQSSRQHVENGFREDYLKASECVSQG